MSDLDPTTLTYQLAAQGRANLTPASAAAGGSVAVTSMPSVTISTLPGSPAQEGVDGTAIAAPAGGSGIRGWLSGCYSKLSSILTAVTGTLATSRTWTLASGTDTVTVAGTLAGITNPVAVTLATAPTTTVTGTVTGNQGTAAAVGSAWPVKNTDGTNTAAVKAASTAPATTDPALVITVSPNTPPAAVLPAATWRQFATGAAAAAGTVTQAAAGAGVKNYLAGFTFSYTGAALTAGTTVQVKDGSTVIYEEYVPQSAATAGAVFRVFTAPLAGTAATAMTVNASAGVTSVTQKVAAWGYTGP